LVSTHNSCVLDGFLFPKFVGERERERVGVSEQKYIALKIRNIMVVMINLQGGAFPSYAGLPS
jgi:hypothetical protein